MNRIRTRSMSKHVESSVHIRDRTGKIDHGVNSHMHAYNQITPNQQSTGLNEYTNRPSMSKNEHVSNTYHDNNNVSSISRTEQNTQYIERDPFSYTHMNESLPYESVRVSDTYYANRNVSPSRLAEQNMSYSEYDPSSYTRMNESLPYQSGQLRDSYYSNDNVSSSSLIGQNMSYGVHDTRLYSGMNESPHSRCMFIPNNMHTHDKTCTSCGVHMSSF